MLKELQGMWSAGWMALISSSTGAKALRTGDSTLTLLTAALDADTRQNRQSITFLWGPEAAQTSESLVSNSF